MSLPLSFPSLNPDSGIHQRIEDIRQEYHHNKQCCDKDRFSQYNGKIVGRYRLNVIGRNAGNGEDLLNDKGTRNAGGHGYREPGDNGNKGVPHDMAPYNLGLRQALGAGRQNVILIQYIQNGRLEQSGIGGDVKQCAGHHGQNGIFPAAEPQLLAGGPADDREPFQRTGEILLEHKASKKRKFNRNESGKKRKSSPDFSGRLKIRLQYR